MPIGTARSLARWWDLCHQMTDCGRRGSDDPIKFADQDALNALLMSDYADVACVIDSALPMGLPEMADTDVVDAERSSVVTTVSSCPPFTPFAGRNHGCGRRAIS